MDRKITIYLAEGLPKGIREAKVDQWSGKAVCGPRNKLPELLKRYKEFEDCCLYFLIGESESEEGGLMNVYVGEADGFKSRMRNHDRNKDWWQNVVAFFAQDNSLTKTSIEYLESFCYDQLIKAGKCVLQNGNRPSRPSIPREDVGGLEFFYEQIALVLPLFGYDIFEQKEESTAKEDQLEIFCHGKDASAVGILLNDGKVKVLKDSKAQLENTPAFEIHNYRKLKDELIRNGRLVKDGNVLIFTNDYTFDSPSAAAAVILARSANGPSMWKTKDGKTLNEIWEKQIS